MRRNGKQRYQRIRYQQHDAGRGAYRRRNDNELTATKLQELLLRDPNEITLSLGSNVNSLREFIDQQIDYDLAELFVKVLKKCLQSTYLKEKNNQILSILLKSNYPTHMSQMIVNNNFREDHVEFFLNLMFILKKILIQNPSEHINTLQIIVSIGVILKDSNKVSVENLENLLEKHNELQRLLHEVTKKNRKQETETVPDLPEAPPEDFRDLEMMPTAEAIQSEEVFIRKNKVKGAYDNVDHYLDVQFRLMREDFFGPLRNGIKEYLSLGSEQKHERIYDMHIYHQVCILYSLCTTDGIGHRVTFDVSKIKINWEQSKRLLYGSLVCLTSDDFKTVYFATVINRKAEELKVGQVDLLFLSNSEDVSHFSSSTVFIMAETTAYFEAYRHILAALKEISEDNMPFKDYIIYGKSEVKAPNYLTQQRNLQMDLTCLIEDSKLVFDSRQNAVSKKQNSKKNLSLNILEDAWPDAEDLKLNDSQHQALQNVLTKEFSLTQGPPGTGKTYIGLKIVKTLCSNSNLWQMNRKSPMLIVCYTNQALDKFLEGIASFLEGGILRVGGRSNSEVLKKYLLKNVKDTYKQEKHFSSEFITNKRMIIEEKNHMKSEIEQMTCKIQQTKQGILREDILKDHMGQFYDWLVKAFEDNFNPETGRSTSVMIQWLGYGNIEILANDIENPNVEQTEEAELSAEEDNVDMHTEADFIQGNRMIDDGSVTEEFSKVEINDDEVIALNVNDLDRMKESTQDGFQKTRKEKKRSKKQLQRDLYCNTQMEDEEVDQICYVDLWSMSKKKRWALYRRWVASYCQQVRDEIRQKEIEYNRVCQVYKELLQHEDGEIMKNSLIIGMTTTAAARYHALLQEIQPKIIVVEEAAEILECHVVTALNPMCEQLILIGDHKQLRPNPNVYELARNFNMEISLFERMVLNKCHVKCLSHQHRMRPEISQLLRPIYSELQDHPSVTKYENIKGVSTNVYFIQHNELELTNKEASSYSNPHEASYIVELCKYFLKQGYNPSQITILTTYTAQLFYLKNLMKNGCCKGVRLTVVDNFQGEENDIILLSLVRNNVDKKIGFLKSSNRVCVALSRAKMGFYIIGNIKVFSEQTKLWNSILQISRSENLIGYSLTLSCQNHPDRNTQIRNAIDFNQSPEGGCLKPCESRLKCGHTCKRTCHPIDDHDVYKCMERCPKTAPGCPDDHKCTHMCSEKCGRCMEMVVKIKPNCNHQQKMACSQNPSQFKCETPCEKYLPCGHKCTGRCGDSCNIQCRIKVTKTFPCNHTVKIPCFQTVCPEKCSKHLDCGHKCSSICGQCSERRVHSICSHGCGRLLVCGHKCPDRQCDVCSPCFEYCENRCIHSKCMRLCGELCVPCNEPCEWRCEHYECSRYCHESCDRPKCDRPCLKMLICNHPCVGLCGEKCPRLCRVCNKEELTEIFFGNEDEEDACFVELEDCKHVLEKSGLDLWMSQETDSEIQLKVCPKCRVPIRRNLRYGQIINKTLMDINRVKERLIGDKLQIKQLILHIKRDLEKLPEDYRYYIKHKWCQSQKIPSSLYYWSSFRDRITFILALVKLMEKYVLKDDLQKHCKDLLKWLSINEEIFSKAQLEEIEIEIERIGKLLQFHKTKTRASTLSEDNTKRLIEQGLTLLTSKDYSIVRDKVLEIERRIPTLLKLERIAIVKAIALPPGHWYKCPKGHLYVIGDCGRANQRSTCPDCGSAIGGESYLLESGNTRAQEINLDSDLFEEL